ncbi:DUF4236 domain-containing protein [Leifsonia sp. NPDC058248]|uniref:DUF4236 domain-containing protein n=1 Tax=Leifsonia sp. NPDC058248 TaxID=3346402 RepID=UPI0036DE9153
MGFSVRIAPGIRVRASSRGVRTSIGPRAARIHIGGGGTGVSTGAGPFTYYTNVGGGTTSRRTTAKSTSRTTMTLAQAAKSHEAERLREAIDAITKIHQESFAPAVKPLCPPPPPADAATIRRQFAAAAVKGLPFFDRAGRKAAKAKAASDADARIEWETAQLRQKYDGYQEELNEQWAKLLANDPDVVLQQLASAFEDNEASAAPLGVSDGEASLVVLLPDEDSVPERYPTLTPAGNLSLKKMSKKEHDAFYNVVAAGYTLVTIKEAFAVAPSLRSVRIIAVRANSTDAFGKKRGEALLAGRVHRERLDGVQWATVDAPTILSDISDELLINQKGAARTLTPLDLSQEPELGQVMGTIDFDELD